MGKRSRPPIGYKAPLIFSALLALVAGVCTFTFATGGWSHTPRLDLAMIAAGSVFIIALTVSAMLTMTYKPNEQRGDFQENSPKE